MKTSTQLKWAFSGILLFASLMYVFELPINPRFVSWQILIFICLLPATKIVNWERGDFESFNLVSVKAVLGLLTIGITTMLLTTCSAFQAKEYHSLLGETAIVEHADSLPVLDLKKAPLVTQEMAKINAEKRLSEVSGLGSQYHINSLHKQAVKGELVWVGFLEYSGFFRWLSNDGFSPGYVIVSSHNPSDVKVVTEVGGKKLGLKFLESAWFNQSASRKIYFNNLFNGITDITHEIDDNGNPFIVASVYNKTVGISGQDIVGVSVLNVQSGEVHNYTPENAPLWIDRVQPLEMISDQVGYRGEYIHGWWNSLFEKKDVLQVSSSDVIYGRDNQCYLYVSVTSAGRDSSISGYYLVDSRNKKSTFYQMSGSDELSAKKAIEMTMPEKGYHATNALPYLVSGIATYVMAVADKEGINRAYGFVSVKDNQVLGVGDTLQVALNAYLSKASMSKTKVRSGEVATSKTIVAKIDRITYSMTDAMFQIENDPRVFLGTVSSVGEILVLSRTGDMVEIQFEDAGTSIVTINSFKRAK